MVWTEKSIQSFYQLSDKILKREDIDKLLKKQWGMLSGGEKSSFMLLF